MTTAPVRAMRHLHLWVVIALAGLFVANAFPALAQRAPGTIAGAVRDAHGPLRGVLVRLDPDHGADSAQLTDAAGRFRFAGVGRGAHTLRAIRIGYVPRDIGVLLGDAAIDTTIELVALPPTLDTLRITARPSSLIGTVFSERDQRVLNHVRVSLQASPFGVDSDSAGRFVFDRIPPGSYVLYANAAGFLPQMLSVTITRDGATEVSIGMRPPGMDPNRERAALMAEFNERTRTASVMYSALIPRQELMANENELLSFAISTAPTFLKKGLRFSVECLFINGQPAPASALDDIKVSQVEAVEVYGPGADWSQTLARRWGSRPSCRLAATTVVARRRTPLTGRDAIQAVVVWLRE